MIKRIPNLKKQRLEEELKNPWPTDSLQNNSIEQLKNHLKLVLAEPLYNQLFGGKQAAITVAAQILQDLAKKEPINMLEITDLIFKWSFLQIYCSSELANMIDIIKMLNDILSLVFIARKSPIHEMESSILLGILKQITLKSGENHEVLFQAQFKEFIDDLKSIISIENIEKIINEKKETPSDSNTPKSDVTSNVVPPKRNLSSSIYTPDTISSELKNFIIDENITSDDFKKIISVFKNCQIPKNIPQIVDSLMIINDKITSDSEESFNVLLESANELTISLIFVQDRGLNDRIHVYNQFLQFFFDILSKLLNNQKFLKKLARVVLQELIEQMIIRLLKEEEISNEKKNEEGFVHNFNVFLMNILHNAHKNDLLLSLINLLIKYRKQPKLFKKGQGLILKGILFVSKNIEISNSNEIKGSDILIKIDDFLKEYSKEIMKDKKSLSNDLAVKTLKILLTDLVKAKGENILNDLKIVQEQKEKQNLKVEEILGTWIKWLLKTFESIKKDKSKNINEVQKESSCDPEDELKIFELIEKIRNNEEFTQNLTCLFEILHSNPCNKKYNNIYFINLLFYKKNKSY